MNDFCDGILQALDISADYWGNDHPYELFFYGYSPYKRAEKDRLNPIIAKEANKTYGVGWVEISIPEPGFVEKFVNDWGKDE